MLFFTEWKARKLDRAFKEQMIATMNYLLGFSKQDYISKVFQDFPGIVSSIRNWRVRGDLASGMAAEALSIVLTTDIENMDSVRRAKIIDDLMNPDRVDEAKDPFSGMVSMFHTQSDFLMNSGQLAEDRRAAYISELFGALKGVSRGERSTQRILSALDED